MNSTQKKKQVVAVSWWRYRAVSVIFYALFTVLIVRAAYLQVIDTSYLQSQGDARYLRVQKEPPTRGMIVDRTGQPLAISTPVDSLWIHPPTILAQANRYSYQRLSALLDIPSDYVLKLAKSRKERQFAYLKRHLSPKLVEQIHQLDIPGVNSMREYKRYYPTGPVMGHLLGFTNIDNVGQEGVELAFNGILNGRTGKGRVMQDGYGRVVEKVEQINRVRHGEELMLSVDARIQYLAYRHLRDAVKRHQAVSGSVVVLAAKTGEVLAMVNEPGFNPNDRAQLKSSRFRNRAITDSFEPGSTMKPFTVALALDEDALDVDNLIDTQPGHMFIGQERIDDTRNFGVLNAAGVIQKSSNVGAAKIAMKMPAKELFDIYKALGFGTSNRLQISGENRGILTQRKRWRPIEHATLAYGYGLSVNTLQLARAYQALANDGILLPISLLPVEQIPEGHRVFTKETIVEITKMMELAVSDEGTAPKARVDDYRVAGKTGTAHLLVDGQYQEDHYLSLFAGFAPSTDPDMVIAVTINDPRGVDYYGGLVAAPVFSEVLSGALRFRDVQPDNLNRGPDEESLKINLATTTHQSHG